MDIILFITWLKTSNKPLINSEFNNVEYNLPSYPTTTLGILFCLTKLENLYPSANASSVFKKFHQ